MKLWPFGAALCLMVSAGCSSQQQKASEYAATASSLFSAGDYQAARVAISQANALRDDVPDQWLLQGRIEAAMSHALDAYQAYSRVLELDATNQEALQLVAEFGFQVGAIRQADDAADRLLSINPSATRALLIKGLIKLDNRRIPDALGFADQILKLQPGDEGGTVLKARALAIDGKADAALELISANIARTGKTNVTLATLLEIYRLQGDIKNLIPAFIELTGKMPNNIDLKVDFANTLYKSGDPAGARNLLWGIMKAKADDGELLAKIGSLWAEYDGDALSGAQLQEIGESGSDAMRMMVGRHLLSRNRAQDAEILLRPAANRQGDASASDLVSLYARALEATGQSARAVSLADAVLKSDTNNADALLIRARFELGRGDARAAINDAQIVVRDHPQNEQGVIQLASIFAGQSQNWRARQILAQAADDTPQNYAIAEQYVKFLYHIDDKAGAMSAARDFTHANPASLRGWGLLTDACTKLGDSKCLSDAQAGNQKALKTFAIDEQQGAPRQRGVFGRL